MYVYVYIHDKSCLKRLNKETRPSFFFFLSFNYKRHLLFIQIKYSGALDNHLNFSYTQHEGIKNSSAISISFNHLFIFFKQH